MNLDRLKSLAYSKMLKINNTKKDLSIFKITKKEKDYHFYYPKLDIHSQGKTKTEVYNNMIDEMYFCLDDISG